jgi:hypothetical protein
VAGCRLTHTTAASSAAPTFSSVNVATALSKFGKLCGLKSFPRNIAVDDRFRGLMLQARVLCADGRLQARQVANVTHAVAKMSAAGKLATDDAEVQGTLAALKQRAVLVVTDMAPQHVSITWWAFATLGLEPAAEARAALEAAVVRVGPDMDSQHIANTWWAFWVLGLMPGAEAWTALQSAVVRAGPDMTAQEVSSTVFAYARFSPTRSCGGCRGLRRGRHWRLRWCGWVGIWLFRTFQTLGQPSRC